MEQRPTEVKSGFYRFRSEDEMEYVVPSSSNDDVLKVFSVFLFLLFGMIVSGIIWVMSYVIEFPEFLQN